MKPTLYCAISAITLTTSTASAALLMNISDAGGGNTRFVFSGSATFTSTAAGSPTTYVGIFVDDSLFAGTPFLGSAGFTPFVSGSGTQSVNGGPNIAIDEAAIFSNFLFGMKSPGLAIDYATGNTVSWNGDLIWPFPITSFTPGTYTSNTIGIVGDYANIDSPYILTISGAVIPEPSTYLAIVGMLGLTGFIGWRRTRRKSNPNKE